MLGKPILNITYMVPFQARRPSVGGVSLAPSTAASKTLSNYGRLQRLRGLEAAEWRWWRAHGWSKRRMWRGRVGSRSGSGAFTQPAPPALSWSASLPHLSPQRLQPPSHAYLSIHSFKHQRKSSVTTHFTPLLCTVQCTSYLVLTQLISYTLKTQLIPVKYIVNLLQSELSNWGESEDNCGTGLSNRNYTYY